MYMHPANTSVRICKKQNLACLIREAWRLRREIQARGADLNHADARTALHAHWHHVADVLLKQSLLYSTYVLSSTPWTHGASNCTGAGGIVRAAESQRKHYIGYTRCIIVDIIRIGLIMHNVWFIKGNL